MEMEKEEIKIGITLSGGGVRAAVFHLGVLSRLADDELLDKIKMLSTVSGGTLVVGLIYHSNNNKWPTSVEFKKKCIPYVKKCLTEKNLQLNAIIRTIFWPFPHFGKGRASIISSSIKHCWKINSKLNDIPEIPRWNINATTIESGKSWRFVPNNRMGDYVLNYVEKPDLDLSDAMCSSAAVPFLIGPLKIKTKNFKWFKYTNNQTKEATTPTFKKINIWDGGAYDNLGIEPLLKYNNGLVYRDEINFLLVSDAALAINTERRKWYNPMRLIDVTMDQVRALRARTLWDHFKNNDGTGVYVRIGESNDRIYEMSSKKSNRADIQDNLFEENKLAELKNYPTTLWKMRKNDFEDLFNHGWESANSTIVFNNPLILKKNNI
jgi:NTE family protein